MTIVNNFRYGKISEKMAGRFDAEQFNQGAFIFRNCRSLFDGGVTRRFPLKHLISVKSPITSYIYVKSGKNVESVEEPQSGTTYTARTSVVKLNVLKGFTVGSYTSFVLGFGVRDYGTVSEESVMVAYAFSGNTFVVSGIISLKDVAHKLAENSETPTPVKLSEEICRKMNFSQYYNRMYVVSHYFRTFYVDYLSGSFEVANPEFIFNNDAKVKIGFVKTDYSDSSLAGRTVIEHNGNYYFNTDYTDENKCDVLPIYIEDADSSKISGFNDYEDNSFNKYDGSYPSVVAVINDSIWFANTTKNPNFIWKSRVLGTSQWIEGLDSNTMHDFSQFQVVATTNRELKDTSEWPMTSQRLSDGSYMYHQESGVDKYFSPKNKGNKQFAYDLSHKSKNVEYVSCTEGSANPTVLCYKDNDGDIYYTYDDDHKLVRQAKRYVSEGAGYKYFYTNSENKQVQYKWSSPSWTPVKLRYKRKTNSTIPDPDAQLTQEGVEEDGYYAPKGTLANDKYTYLDRVAYTTDYGTDDYYWFWYKNGLTSFVTLPTFSSDLDWDTVYTSSDSNFKYSIAEYGEPVRQKYETYDMSTDATLYSDNTEIDMVATDSCSVRIELNTGRLDAIRSISLGCEKIIICTSNAEWTLPANFNAVSNMTASKYSSYGALECETIPLNRSLIFLQRGNLLREFYMYESYVMQREATGFNHDLIDKKIIDVTSKNAPDPIFLMLKEDGRLIQAMYDVDAGLNSFADWDIDYGETKKYSFSSVSSLEKSGIEKLVALVSDNAGGQNICLFDEEETEDFSDYIESNNTNSAHTFVTQIKTSYIETSNQSLLFGRNKKTKGVWMRPYNCGRLKIGNDDRQLTLTNYKLANDDYYAPVTGKAGLTFCMFVESYKNEPMTILAFGWEVEQ